MTDRPEHTFHNDLSGATREVVQAGQVSGGVHFHGHADAGTDPPRQLPADVPGFVNRATDLARLDLLLSEGAPDDTATAVCVIVGTAGVGKTSLAVHWAHRVAGSFPDGQLYVNLRGYDGERWPLALALDHLARAVPEEAEQHWRESEALLAAFPDPHATRLREEIRTLRPR